MKRGSFLTHTLSFVYQLVTGTVEKSPGSVKIKLFIF